MTNTECHFFKCDNLRMFTVIDKNNEGESIIDFIGLADVKNKIYLLVGCDFSHPYIECNEFLYVNSDGSGPDVLTAGEKITPNRILRKIAEYYEEFCGDHPH